MRPPYSGICPSSTRWRCLAGGAWQGGQEEDGTGFQTSSGLVGVSGPTGLPCGPSSPSVETDSSSLCGDQGWSNTYQPHGAAPTTLLNDAPHGHTPPLTHGHAPPPSRVGRQQEWVGRERPRWGPALWGHSGPVSPLGA